ncbi:MAG TPA: CPBP family intramembrane glutamic endopeptidase, partial [Candidatus Solibacter sp.]|nr:CPBP family intramembrane glutamic endopeptidase [Candidatus Solibacter sp.]
ETVFRGYVYPVLARKFGIFAGILLTGILFGMVHVPQLWGGWGQIATLVAVGMALTATRAATHSVFASYLVHLGYNGFLFAGFFIPPVVFRHS